MDRKDWKTEKEAEDKQQQEEDVDLTPHEHERALKGAYWRFTMPGLPKTDVDSYSDQAKPYIKKFNQKSAKGNGICKDNHDPMGKMEEAYNATHWIRRWGRKNCSRLGWWHWR